MLYIIPLLFHRLWHLKGTLYLRILRFWHRCGWGFCSLEMWLSVTGSYAGGTESSIFFLFRTLLLSQLLFSLFVCQSISIIFLSFTLLIVQKLYEYRAKVQEHEFCLTVVTSPLLSAHLTCKTLTCKEQHVYQTQCRMWDVSVSWRKIFPALPLNMHVRS